MPVPTLSSKKGCDCELALVYNNSCYMCRITRATKAYKQPTDINPSSIVMNKGTMFISNRNVEIGSVALFEVSASIDDTNNDLPYMFWIASDVLEFTLIQQVVDAPEIQDANDIVAYNDTLLISGSKIVIYDKVDSSTPVTSTLSLGDRVIVDKMINFVNNGITETRYHISDVLSDNHESLSMVGMWIVGNYSVTANNTNIQYHNNSVRTMNMQSRMAVPSSPVANDASNNDSYSWTSSPRGASRADALGFNTTVTDTSTVTTDSNPELSAIEQEFGKTLEEMYNQYGFYYSESGNSFMSSPIGRMLFVHGMPFQYTHFTDRRGNSKLQYGREVSYESSYNKSQKDGTVDMYGRTFSKEIACNMPIAVIVPGTPKFMTNIKQGLFGYQGSDKQTRNNWVPFWSDLSDSELESAIEKLMEDGNEEYQYYSMTIDTTDYFNYVNALCQTSAKLMGLSDVTYHGKKCDKLDWGKYNASADQDYSMFEEVTGVSGGVSFAFDPLSSITDSISNSTGESQFAGMLNGLSSKARELEFMTGTAGVDLSVVNSTDYEEATATVSSGFMSGVTNPLSRISAFLKNSAHGMNVRFPLIWNDSSSDKSYDLDMRFIAPYATAFCKWRYVLVPFFHIFCLVAPRSDDTISNYKRPFLIRAFSKGYFNVEMGIIESLQWKRFGDGDMISEDGVPTQIDVSVSFRDLYQQLAMSKFGNITGSFDKIGIFFNNTGLMDMLGTLSGVNMNRITLGERLSLYASSSVGAFAATGSNFMRYINNRVRNITETYFVGL